MDINKVLKRKNPEKRKKVSTACDICKKRKFKCTGEKPCKMCQKRNTSCTYTVIDKRSLKGERLAKLKLQKSTQGSNQCQNKEIKHTFETKYIPKSLQPLLSFPLDNEMQSPSGEIFDGVLPVVLLNSYGDFKYFGETSPVSLLFECKEIYTKKLGDHIFSETKEILLHDSPVFVENFRPIELPSRIDMEELLYYFKFNINDIYFVVDFPKFCADVVNPVYEDINGANKRNHVLVYLVASLGLLFKGFSRGTELMLQAKKFLEQALVLTKQIPEDDSLWLVQVYFLIHFYYEFTSNRTESWLNLGTAIRYAQSLGMHRKHINLKVCKNKKEIEYRENLFRSLYICDRITSVFLGRPLSIYYYEKENLVIDKIDQDFHMKCQLELADLSTIIGRIMELFYNEKSIDINVSKELAIELKKWTINLDKELKVDNIIQWKMHHDDTLQSQHNNYILLLVHLLQLYGIMILCRPFLIFEVMNPRKLKERSKYGKLSYDFYIAGVKSSILTIKLINFFINSNRRRPDSYVIMACCAFATLMICIKLIHGEFENEPFSVDELMSCIRSSIHILSLYESFNCNAKIFLREISNMEKIIRNQILEPNGAEKAKHNIDSIATISDLNFIEGRHNTDSISLIDDLKFIEDKNSIDSIAAIDDLNFIDDNTYNLETLKGFQQFFV